jgi:hypothetical protein
MENNKQFDIHPDQIARMKQLEELKRLEKEEDLLTETWCRGESTPVNMEMSGDENAPVNTERDKDN